MIKALKYRSFSIDPFSAWRIIILLLLLPSVYYGLILMQPDKLIYILTLTLFILFIYMLQSFSIVTYDGESLYARSLFKRIHLKKVRNIRTWWSYDIGMTTREFDGEFTGKVKGHVNKMNVFVEFTSSDSSVYIYEQIHLGNKFPNNHQYIENEDIDKSKLIKVWDIDNCLKILNLTKRNIDDG